MQDRDKVDEPARFLRGVRKRGRESPVPQLKPLTNEDEGVLAEDLEPTETIDVGHLFTKDLTESGSFDIRQDIWATTFGKLLQALPIPAILVNKLHAIKVANEACRRIAENYDGLEGMAFSDMFPTSAARNKTLGLLEDVFTKRKTQVMMGTLRFGNRRTWARMTMRPIRIMNERFVLMLVEDLTKEKILSKDLEKRVAERTAELLKANESLKQRERFLSTVFASIQDGMAILNAQLDVLRVNPAMERWYSHMMPIMGKKCYAAFHGRDRPCEICPTQKTLATKRSGFAVTPKKGPGGTIVGWLDLYTFPIINIATGELKGVIEYVRDVTDRRKLEEQLRQAVKMEAVGSLAGGIAHDFNNILTGILGYSTMLAEQIGQEGLGHGKALQINRAAQRATKLTHQLLAFSRRQILEMKIMDLNNLLTDLEEMLRPLIGEHIHLETRFGRHLANVSADPAQMTQVALNLVVNARDAMPGGGNVTIETANIVLDDACAHAEPAVERGNYAMFSVMDTGYGMDAETCARCFEPFFTTKEKGAGTGLGLSTVYGIVRQHNGHITVASEVGKGTIFRVYLPQVEGEGQVAGEPASDSRPTDMQQAQGGGETILLVEDDDLLRDMISEALETLGYHVIAASSAEEAIAIVDNSSDRIDLLLTDVILPKMDGRSLGEALAGVLPEMAVLYMSGYTDDFIVRHGVLDPDVSFISKPFSSDALARKVREKLDER